MKLTTTHVFSQDDVRDWCGAADDSNQLHLDPQKAADHKYFEEPFVPTMMLLGTVEGAVSQWAQTKDGSPTISRLNSVSFDRTIPVGTEFQTIIKEESEPSEGEHILIFKLTESVAAECAGSGLVTVHLV